MVTHTWNLSFNPSSAHTLCLVRSEQTHTGNCGQSFLLYRPRSDWGLGALLKSFSRYWKSNPQSLG